MRTLNDYFIMGGNMTAIQTADNASPVCVIPDGGKLKDAVNLPIVIPSNDTARIQEVHITIGHIICEIIEEDY